MDLYIESKSFRISPAISMAGTSQPSVKRFALENSILSDILKFIIF